MDALVKPMLKRQGIDPQPWRQARRILAVRLDNQGNVLLTTPALRALRQALLGRRITLLSMGSGATAAAHVPEVDAVISIPCPWMASTGNTPPTPQELNDTVEQLRAGRFDGAVIFTSHTQSPLPAAMLCWQAGIPLRLAHCHENPHRLLSDWIEDPEPQEILRHEVRRQLDLVAAIGARATDEHLSFCVHADDMSHAMTYLRAHGIDPTRPWIVVHPGASAESQRYPPDAFAEALRVLMGARLAADPWNDWQVVLTGSETEATLCNALSTRLAAPAASLAGRLSLGELAAVIAPAALLIANNTGPVHLAAALGTPVVDIYALTNPQHVPWMVPHLTLYHDEPSPPNPHRVAEAARQLLEMGTDLAGPGDEPLSHSAVMTGGKP
ncbi:MAG TPA: glycosyltransferase family 9 protein [Rhodocyclaceae bacterium]|nr:glycosyltransferase family 9 protein [Rhodocyclaceae bacterium]